MGPARSSNLEAIFTTSWHLGWVHLSMSPTVDSLLPAEWTKWFCLFFCSIFYQLWSKAPLWRSHGHGSTLGYSDGPGRLVCYQNFTNFAGMKNSRTDGFSQSKKTYTFRFRAKNTNTDPPAADKTGQEQRSSQKQLDYNKCIYRLNSGQFVDMHDIICIIYKLPSSKLI